MAELSVTRKKGEERQGGLTRWGESLPWFPSPREFFSLSPFALMRRMTEEMDRMFSGWGGETGERIWAPDIDVFEREGKMVVRADLPGLKKDEVKVEITDDGLILQGERKREHEEKREGFYRSERSYGRFYRAIPLPEGANIDQARAQFNDGVLEVSVPIPKSEQKRREIPIESGGERTRAGGGGA